VLPVGASVLEMVQQPQHALGIRRVSFGYSRQQLNFVESRVRVIPRALLDLQGDKSLQNL
jgi:hypothetical protein